MEANYNSTHAKEAAWVARDVAKAEKIAAEEEVRGASTSPPRARQ